MISFSDFLSLDLPAILAALFSAISCGLVGNFLVLRKQSMMADAISHSVLPGIVLAFLYFGTRNNIPVLLGASLSALVCIFLIEVLKKNSGIDSGAAIGVVFSLLFALGVLLMEQASVSNVDLDAECLLYGQLEGVFLEKEFDSFFSWLSATPLELRSSAFMLFLVTAFVVLFSKELKIFSFDAQHAESLGFSYNKINTLLMFIVGLVVVFSFKVVGAILVISMIIAPAATARFYTNSYNIQIILSLIFSVFFVLIGYFAAVFIPSFYGLPFSFNAAGMIVCVSAFFFVFSFFFSPKYGQHFISKGQLRRTSEFVMEDLLGVLYRVDEDPSRRSLYEGDINHYIDKKNFRKSLRRALKLGYVHRNDGNMFNLELTSEGRKIAKNLVKSHRLWESFLVNVAGMRKDHVHQRAMHLEHFTTKKILDSLDGADRDSKVDPHGKPIP